MPDSADLPDGLVDTSVAVAVAVEDHPHHLATLKATSGRRLGLCGHACFETYSVLTRLPAPLRRTPGSVVRLLQRNFPHTRFLSDNGAALLLGELPALGLGGGAVYDALVAACAREQRVALITRDRRALGT